MKIREVTSYLETIAPLHLQESYDNAGLLVGDADQEVKGVLVTLDSTEEVVSEAIEQGCNLIVAHHPIIFGGLRRLTGQSYIDRTVTKAIKNDIALYAIHTNLDNVLQNGVNQEIGQRLGLGEMQILSPKKEEGYPEGAVGSGLIGTLPQPMDPSAFKAHLKEKMNLAVIKHTRFLGKKIARVALCGGSGRFLLNQALLREADVFISSDFKYHEYFDANGQITICDIGHYESERYTIELLERLLREKFSTFALCCTKVNTNPIIYS